MTSKGRKLSYRRFGPVRAESFLWITCEKTYCWINYKLEKYASIWWFKLFAILNLVKRDLFSKISALQIQNNWILLYYISFRQQLNILEFDNISQVSDVAYGPFVLHILSSYCLILIWFFTVSTASRSHFTTSCLLISLQLDNVYKHFNNAECHIKLRNMCMNKLATFPAFKTTTNYTKCIFVYTWHCF